MPERLSPSRRAEYGTLVQRHGAADQLFWDCLKHHRERYDRLLAEQLYQDADGGLGGLSVCCDSSRDATCEECTAAVERWEKDRPTCEEQLRALVSDPRVEWQLVAVESHALTFKLASVADLDGNIHAIVPEEHRARLASFEVLVRVGVTTHGLRAEEPVWR